jgi:hypothetical protein
MDTQDTGETFTHKIGDKEIEDEGQVVLTLRFGSVAEMQRCARS